MVRPTKLGINYFPLDIDMDQDDKIQMIEAKYPEKGFEIITKLWMKIYKEGYYYKWGEKEQLLFTNKIPNVDIDYINAVIEDAVKWEIFDRKRFVKYKILTSNGIQKRYLEATKRRKEVEIISEYWVNLNNNSENDNIIFKKVDNKKQSKVQYSTVKENKVNNNLAFEELWKRYPNKDGKKLALKHFKTSIKTEQDLKNINIALEKYLNSDRVKNGYIKNGSTWFNNWQDWIEYKENKKIDILDMELE